MHRKAGSMYYFLLRLFKKIFIGNPTSITPIEYSDPPVGTGSPIPFEEKKEPKVYELIATTRSEPYRGHAVLSPADSRFVYTGSTTYLFQEKTTGEFRSITLAGSEESQLTSLLEKVDEQGTVRLTKNGVTYLIGIVPPEDKIPVR